MTKTLAEMTVEQFRGFDAQLEFNWRMWNMRDEIKTLDKRIAFVDDVNGFIEVTMSNFNGQTFKNELLTTFVGLVSIVAKKYQFELFIPELIENSFNCVFRFRLADDLTIERN